MRFQAVNRCLMASVWWGSDFRLSTLLTRFDPSGCGPQCKNDPCSRRPHYVFPS